ncbi:nucleoporin Nup43-like protein [Aphelenchoides avenae]|nr:nucleoporin Nup43-like protein [Aphelenchus avenae]
MRLDTSMESDAPQGLFQRYFAESKVSKVKFLCNAEGEAGYFVTGSWDSPKNNVALWTMDSHSDAGPVERKAQVPVGADVNDICVASETHFVTALDNGEVQAFRVKQPSRTMTSLESVARFTAAHGKFPATAVCVLDEVVVSGGQDGSISKMSMSGSSKHASSVAKELTGVRCLVSSGSHTFASGHNSGQIHLWDIRQQESVMAFGSAPVSSRAVCPLNEAITTIASHPAQPNVVGYGTQSGEVAFTDIRRRETPGLLKIAQDPILELKFHPIYSNNCFSVSETSLLHWDATQLTQQVM